MKQQYGALDSLSGARLTGASNRMRLGYEFMLHGIPQIGLSGHANGSRLFLCFSWKQWAGVLLGGAETACSIIHA